MPNVVSSFYKHKASSQTIDLLSKMIDSGKELYLRICSQTIVMLIRWDIQRAESGVLKTKVICGVILSKRNALQ
jgi:hypothetical protein